MNQFSKLIILIGLVAILGFTITHNLSYDVEAVKTFDEVYAILKKGKVYSPDVPTGKLLRTHKINGIDHPYLIFIPQDYDPKIRYPVQWDLHGGMGQPEWKKLDGSWSGWGGVKEEDYQRDHILVAPAGWWDSMWWTSNQADNFKSILEELKSTWNINENRVFVIGNSDGAVATWFYAFRYPDPWVFYTGYVGFPARLTNNSMRADGQMHLTNLEGQRFHLRNGVQDKIVNIDVVRGYLEVFKSVDVKIEYYEHPNSGHNLSLTNEQASEPYILARNLRRDPLPDTLSWSTERTDRYNRHFWLIIEKLDPTNMVDETNILPRIYGKNVPNTPPFKSKPWGRVRLQRDGNTVVANTVGVDKFRLLLSPEEFDFSRSIKLVVNGKTIQNAIIERNIKTLEKWNSIDKDRNMLFAAELLVEVE